MKPSLLVVIAFNSPFELAMVLLGREPELEVEAWLEFTILVSNLRDVFLDIVTINVAIGGWTILERKRSVLVAVEPGIIKSQNPSLFTVSFVPSLVAYLTSPAIEDTGERGVGFTNIGTYTAGGSSRVEK
ncbi:hypothetical protein Tco_0396913 [Tanacetum coccineum]